MSFTSPNFIGLGLFRKALKSTEQALLIDSNCLRAYEIQARTYIAMKKIDKAKECAILGLQKINNYSDYYIANQLYEILVQGNSPPPQTTTTNTTISQSSPSSSQQSQSQQQQQTTTIVNETNQSNNNILSDSTKSNKPRIKEEEEGSLKELISLEHLTHLRDHFVSTGTQEEANASGKVHCSYIVAARQNLSFATGIDVIDDLIAFGYLVVNSNRLKEALDLFQVLLAYK